MKIITTNKRAYYDYEILETFEAGIALTGQEVKSVKSGGIQLNGSYVIIKDSEVWLLNANIPPYKYSGKLENYNQKRTRKLLLKKREIKKLIGKKKEHLTIIPLKVYTKRNLIKIEIGVGRGKRKIDKREEIKKRELSREIQKTLKYQI